MAGGAPHSGALGHLDKSRSASHCASLLRSLLSLKKYLGIPVLPPQSISVSGIEPVLHMHGCHAVIGRAVKYPRRRRTSVRKVSLSVVPSLRSTWARPARSPISVVRDAGVRVDWGGGATPEGTIASRTVTCVGMSAGSLHLDRERRYRARAGRPRSGTRDAAARCGRIGGGGQQGSATTALSNRVA